MAKPDNVSEKQTWGTWEELLLACAVHRYGADSWDSVAMEVQKRSSTLSSLTPLSCKQKYIDLRSRFARNDNAPIGDDDKATTEIGNVPWLEELRQLRVAELRREVERYDLSIVSLQLKVKSLEEERERSLREKEKGTERSDLEKAVELSNEEKKEIDCPPETVAGEVVSGAESDPENRSMNASNSTDPKGKKRGTGQEEAEKGREPVDPVKEPSRTAGNGGILGEDSYNGSCNSMAKESAENLEIVDPEREAGESNEFFDSVAESLSGGEGGGGEGSDVQSSASLARKEKKGKEPVEPDSEDQSPAIKRVSVESKPLVDFLEILRSHKFGSIFERRLESQETPKYKDLIRQHLDLETIRIHVEQDSYSGCNIKFFRDLLLLFSNAILFYDKRCSEFKAAVELRKLVLKEIPLKIPKSTSSSKEQISPEAKPLNPDTEPSHPLVLKPRISVPIIACRKRSSITAKASTSSSGPDKKRSQTVPLLDEKLVLDWKTEEPRVTRKRTRERSSANTKQPNNNVKNSVKTKKQADINTNIVSSSKGGSSNESSESKKAEKDKKNNVTSNTKKQSAANFLNRMKQSGSPHNASLLSSSAASSDKGKVGGEQKKNNNGNGNSKGDSRKNQTPRNSSIGKSVKENGSSTKKSIGRPPKRAAAAASTPAAMAGKRGREGGETEAGSSGHLKKRSRR
ncbi:uncharacterized protein LOC110811752 [Carica papaya]|uniref:uncharacterized protein LOC110811752 n=1 Tax=Carica papaya TaxID=3649 RepID=UPI000B8CB514|nr:uncharacterized protein LOC110811752 [Carica papaya]